MKTGHNISFSQLVEIVFAVICEVSSTAITEAQVVGLVLRSDVIVERSSVPVFDPIIHLVVLHGGPELVTFLDTVDVEIVVPLVDHGAAFRESTLAKSIMHV